MAIQSVRCPRCGEAVLYDEDAPVPQNFPFCNRRCGLLDLGDWFDERFKSTRAIHEADLDQTD